MAVETTREQLAALRALPPDAPVFMVNLLRFKPDGGEARYQRYARDAAPHLARVGARPRFAGTAAGMIIGDDAEPWWDAILVVEYPTPSAFLAMVTDPAYGVVHEHRAAALERAELIPTSAWPLG